MKRVKLRTLIAQLNLEYIFWVSCEKADTGKINLVATIPELRAYAQKQDDEREAFEAKLNATKEEVSF